MVEKSGTNYASGYVFLRTTDHPEGEILPFSGGSSSGRVYINSQEVSVNTNGKTYSAYISYASWLGQRIAKEVNCPLLKRENGKDRFWTIMFVGKKASSDKDLDDDHFIWKLRPELESALKKIDLTPYELYSLEFNSNINELLDFYEKSFEQMYHGITLYGRNPV